MTRTAILLLVVLFSLACSSLAIFGRDKKVATTIEDVLKDAGLAKKYLSVFLEKGWDNSPSVLRRLSKMDLHGIDMSDKEVRDAYLFLFFFFRGFRIWLWRREKRRRKGGCKIWWPPRESKQAFF